MGYLVWVGPRDIDVQFNLFFHEKICYYSKSNITPYRKSQIYGSLFNNYIEEKMKTILLSHPDSQFMFYNPKIAYNIDDKLKEHVVCLNDKYVLELLSNKIYTRFWLGNYVPVLSSILLESHNLSLDIIEKKMNHSEAYVIQQNRSSGGFGTFYITKNNGMLSVIKNKFNELLIISPYISHGIPVNVNAIIFSDDIFVFPPSIQIIRKEKERLLYHGADYIAAQTLTDTQNRKLNLYTSIILEHVQNLGYLGIIGIDFIITEDEIYFLEINPRFQASSFLIDLSLFENELPSIAEINMASFNHYNILRKLIKNLKINYSFYKYLYSIESRHLFYIENIAQNNPYVSYICLDGWNNKMKMEEDAYCYSLVFSTNIISLNMDLGVNLYSNIFGEEEYLKENIHSQIGLKIALLNQGCNLPDTTIQFLNGTVKKAVFSSIDFQMADGLYINSPVGLKFTDFSPFHIEVNAKKDLELFWYDQIISKIYIEMQPKWTECTTKNNVPYTKIAYLSTDRLRLKHEFMCHFKIAGNGCRFCNIPINTTKFEIGDLQEIIEKLLPNPTFRHILIGGGSGNIDSEYKQIVYITKAIRKLNKYIPIYLMSIPPRDLSILKEYKLAGITEIAFNIEIWDQDHAIKIMPGKGRLSREFYFHSLKAATELWGTTGNVRSALIVGLNSTDSLIKAIKELSQNGIQPMLSVFRPLINTKLESVVPPSNLELLNLFHIAQAICNRYNLKLGPSCDACKNNMLAI